MTDYPRGLGSHYLRLLLSAWGHLKRSYLFRAGFLILAVFCLISVVGPFFIRDPVNWRAPEEDLIDVDEYWEIDTSQSSYGGMGSTNFSVAVRLKPTALDTRADRVYIASGRNLIAVNPSTGWRVWLNTSQSPSVHTCCFPVDSEISTEPVAVNFGSSYDLAQEDQYVFVGTSEGSLYVLREERFGGVDEDLSPLPSGDNVTVLTVDGSVSSIAAYSDGLAGLSPEERVFVGSGKGTLYAFSPNGTMLWSRSLGGNPVLMANLFPTKMRMMGSACVDYDGDRIFVNDGNLRALWTENGTDVWTGLPGGVFPMGSSWSSPPYLATISMPHGELIYAGSDDGTLHVVFPQNGTVLFSKYLDDGRLTTPMEGGSYILVGSSSGMVYTVRRDQVGDLPMGSVRGEFQAEGEPTTPLYRLGSWTFLVGDSEGYVYSVSMDGRVSFRVRFEGRVQGHPLVWGDQYGSGHLHDLAFVTNSPGMIHAISSLGMYLAPLPPGCYESGNCYPLGTDNQGRDILSLLIAGFSVVWVTILSAFLIACLGTFLGTISGYLDGWWTFFIMLLVNVSLAIPILILALVLVSVMGAPWYSHLGILLTLVLFLSAPVTKLIDVETRELKSTPLFTTLGSGMNRKDHYLRNVLPRMLVRGFSYSKIVVPTFLLVIFGLEFIGLGSVDTPGWGQMFMLVAQSNVLGSWWCLVFPGICILLLGLAMGLIGQSFEELANRMYRRAFDGEDSAVEDEAPASNSADEGVGESEIETEEDSFLPHDGHI